MLSSAKLFETAQNQLDHQRLFALINSLNDGFLSVDEDGIIRLSNGVALNLLDSNSLEGKPISQVMALTDGFGQNIDAYTLIKNSKNGLTTRDYSLKLSDNSLINLHISIAPIRSAYGNSPQHEQKGHVVVIRDITYEKNKDDERDEFISVVSHELTTPVAVAEGSISNAILMADRANMPAAITQTLKSAHEQLYFLMSLINDLALLSRAESGRPGLLTEEVKVDQLVADLAKDYQGQLAKKGLGFITKNENAGGKLYSNRLYIREILQNLISNAFKYTEKGTVSLTAIVEPNRTVFKVADTGIGIDKPDQLKLFTKFFRSEDYRVRQSSGTGLGLYVSRKLAKLLGGQIEVISELNKGSIFILTLPNSVYHSQTKPA